MWYECLTFRQTAWLCCVIVLCFMCVVLGGGSTGQWCGGGSLSPVCNGFLGWFPCVGPLRSFRFGVGYSWSFWLSDGSPPVISV